MDCPLNPEKKGKASVNTIKTIPSTSGEDREDTVQVNVVTRAQARQTRETQTDFENQEGSETSRKSWKARRARRAAARKRREEAEQQEAAKENNQPENEEQKRKVGNDQIMETGSVIVERVFEPLKAMLEAYEARLKPKQNPGREVQKLSGSYDRNKTIGTFPKIDRNDPIDTGKERREPGSNVDSSELIQ